MSLRLELVYCTKNGRRYGPYGPYWYRYWWDRKEKKTRCAYVGKAA